MLALWCAITSGRTFRRSSALDVLTQGVFQHRLEVAAIVSGDFAHLSEKLRRRLTGEFLTLRNHREHPFYLSLFFVTK